MWNTKEERDDLVYELYNKYGSMSQVSKITMLNYRTVRGILVNKGITSFSRGNQPKMIVFKNGEKTYTFNSISDATRFFYIKDIEKREKLLSNMSTLKEGMNYKVRKLETHRRFIRKALSGAVLYDSEWEVSEII